MWLTQPLLVSSNSLVLPHQGTPHQPSTGCVPPHPCPGNPWADADKIKAALTLDQALQSWVYAPVVPPRTFSLRLCPKTDMSENHIKLGLVKKQEKVRAPCSIGIPGLWGHGNRISRALINLEMWVLGVRIPSVVRT